MSCPPDAGGVSGGKCVPCEGGDVKALTREQASAAVAQMPLWRLQEEPTLRLSRSFEAKNFKAAMQFINSVAEIAEEQGHHSDLHITSYRQVEIVLYTHSVGGITENDLVLGKLLDQVPVEYSKAFRKTLDEGTQASAV